MSDAWSPGAVKRLNDLLEALRKEVAGVKVELRRMNDENEKAPKIRFAEEEDKGTAEPL